MTDSRQSPVNRTTMQRFEYLAVYVNSSGAYQTANGTWRDINELGALGWELVSVVNESEELVAFFKRLGTKDVD